MCIRNYCLIRAYSSLRPRGRCKNTSFRQVHPDENPGGTASRASKYANTLVTGELLA
jgi:hypothetical protein